MQSKYLLFIFTILLMSAKCKNDSLIFKEEPSFSIQEASIQKQIPGIENEPIRLEIEFIIKETSASFSLDSIYYQQIKSLIPSKTKLGWRTIIYEKDAQKISEYNGISLKGKMVIFYSENKKNYFTLVEKITQKDDIYLP